MTKAQCSKKPTQRVLSLPKRRWYSPSTWKRNIPLPPRRPISKIGVLLRKTFAMIRKNPKTFFGITFFYALAVFIFVRSFSLGSISAATAQGFFGKLSGSFSQLGEMFVNAGTSISAASGVYQLIVSTICYLALIWYFRQVLSGEKATTKQAFYSGMRPLVPYLLTLGRMGLQLTPIAIAGFLMSLVQGSFVLVNGFEQTIAWIVFALFVLWSLYLITASLFALFIVTLPNMTPVKAFRSANKLVYKRRVTIWSKAIGALVVSLIVGLVLLLPWILWLPAAAPWVFFLLSTVFMSFVQAFLYTMYREIL